MLFFFDVLWQMIWQSLMFPERLTLKKSVVSDCHLIRICPSGKIMLELENTSTQCNDIRVLTCC